METQPNEEITYINIFKNLFSKPNTAFRLILEKDETMSQMIILGIFGFLNAITPILAFEPYDNITIFKLIFKGLVGGAMGWLGIWFLSHLINITNSILRLDTEFEDVYYIFSFSFCPMIITFLLILALKVFISSEIILFLFAILIFVGYIWTFSLLLIGNKFLSKGGWIKNIIAIIIPLAILVFINILMVKLRM